MNISEQQGNPANGLRERYQELMAIKDADQLYQMAWELGKKYHGHGFSTKNLIRFQRTLNSLKGDLPRIQGFLTNFVLKADGEGVIYTG